MKRHQLEHLIRAAAVISNEYEFVIIGSQSILGEKPDAPEDLLLSMEADVYPMSEEASVIDLIDGSLGEGSHFHSNFGYYLQGVDSKTAILPENWKSRLRAIRLENSVGYCLSLEDLAIAKLAANREKDIEFVSLMFNHGLVEKETVLRLALVTVSDKEKDIQTRLIQKINSLFEVSEKEKKKHLHHRR